MLCSQHLRFVFFPFLDDHSSCADAIVSPPIPFINSDFLVNSTAFAFICYYICAIKLVVHYITNPGFKLHQGRIEPPKAARGHVTSVNG